VLRHLRPQIALAVGGLVVIGLLVYGISRQAIAQRPARGGRLVEAVVGPPATLNPVFAISSTETDLTRLMFSGLVRHEADGQVEPDLAERWSVSDDGRVYTFTLRAGALWHDGAPVSVDDVLYTASVAASDLAQKAPIAAAWERVEAEAVDTDTVRIRLKEPYAPFLQAASLGLLPAHLLADVEPGQLLTHRFSTLDPVGTGPYQLAQPGGATGDVIRLVRFDGHWANDGRQPYLDEIEIHVFASRAEALEALAQRSVQALGDVPAEAFPALGSEARQYSAVRPGLTLVYLSPNNSLLVDPAVHRALSLATDRAAIIDELLSGQGVIAASPIPPGSWAYDPDLPLPAYDPGAAKASLEQGGWIDSDGDGIRDRDGRNLTFSLETTADPLMVSIADRLHADWARVGIDATVQVLDQQGTVRDLKARAFDALLVGWESADYDPDPYPLWHSSQASSGQNYAGWQDPVADDLMERARQVSPTRIEERRALYQQLQRRFVEVEPAILLYHPVYTYVVADPNIGGIQLPQLLVEPADRFSTLRSWYTHGERVIRGFGGASAPRFTATAPPR
jgi:peptide/nickel transport system substrate-binding protein